MKPRKNYRTRPKKTGAKKRQRVKAQKKRLVDAGVEEARLKGLNIVEIRELAKKTARTKKDKTVKAVEKAPSAKK